MYNIIRKLNQVPKLVRRIYTYPSIHPQAIIVIALGLDAGNNYEEDHTTIKRLNAIDQIEKEIREMKRKTIKMNVFMS